MNQNQIVILVRKYLNIICFKDSNNNSISRGIRSITESAAAAGCR